MEALKELFQYNKINYIVSVDDCYEKQEINDDVLLLQDIVSEPDKYEKIILDNLCIDDFHNIKKLPEDLFKKKVEDAYEYIDPEIKNKLFELLIPVESELTGEKELLINLFNKMREEEVIKEYRYFKDIEQAREFLNNEIEATWQPRENNKVLWFIDREISGNKDAGFELLDLLCSNKYEYNIGILASQNTSDIAGEENFDKKLDDILKQPKYTKNLVWVINKSILSKESLEEFTEEISHGLRRNYTYQITNFLVDSISEGLENSSKTFKNIKQSTINNIILKYSTSEGISMIDTLTRVLMAITKREMNNKISGHFDTISIILNKYEKLCEKLNKDKSEDKNNLLDVHVFRNNEKYNNSINELYYPVSFGDIFEIEHRKYILVSQPCDVQIRGGKGTRNLLNATLLPVTLDEPYHNAYYTLNYYKEGESYYISYRDPLNIDFTLLDLCTLNKDGVAKANLNLLGQSLNKSHRYTTGQRIMLNQVLSEVNRAYKEQCSLHEKYELIKNALEKTEDNDVLMVLDEYKNENFSKKTGTINLNNYEINENYIEYPIKRDSKLEDIYATELMINYGAYITRMGLPGDYASTYKYTNYKVKMPLPKQLNIENELDIFPIQHLNILNRDIDSKGTFIKQQVLELFIKDKYTDDFFKQIKRAINKVMKYNKGEREVTLSWKYFVFEGKEYLNLDNDIDEIILESQKLIESTPKFYDFIINLEGKGEYINEYCLNDFFDEKLKVKSKIALPLNSFTDIGYNIEIDGKFIFSVLIESKEEIIGNVSGISIQISVNENISVLDEMLISE